MKKIFLSGLWLLAAATALCSCANEAAEELPENDPTRQTITASIEQDESRVMLGGDKKLNVHWEAGDEIMTLTGRFNERYRSDCSLISGAGSSVATFLKGEEIRIPFDPNFSKATRQINVKFELIYPVTAFQKEMFNNDVVDAVLYLNLPGAQIYRANNIARGANIMLASKSYVPTEPCTFANVCGAIKFKLPATIPAGDPQVEFISINAGNDLRVMGTAWINNRATPKDWKLTMDPDDSRGTILLGDINKPYSELQKEEIYMVLPPQTYPAGLTINVQNAEGYSMFSATTKKEFTVQRGVIHNLGEMK